MKDTQKIFPSKIELEPCTPSIEPPPIEPPLLPYSTPADEEASQVAIKIMEEAGNAEVMAGELPAPPEVRNSTHSSSSSSSATALTPSSLPAAHTHRSATWLGG